MAQLSGKTSIIVNNQQRVFSYEKHFLICQSCPWKISYFDQSGKIGSIPDEKRVQCPICTTGIIIWN
jgi:hypothetical protein